MDCDTNMGKFWLIQRGAFRQNGTTLTGRNGVVNLDYMGASEFEWGAIPKAYRRLMYEFPNYGIFNTNIYTPEQEELLIFCKKEIAVELITAIQQFIESPYHLKKYSELEKVPEVKKEGTLYEYRRSDFWWCIDFPSAYGDWMAFLQPQLQLFTDAITKDYETWWMDKTPDKREEEYRKSLVR